MAIIIRNLGGDQDTDLRLYEVRINQEVITEFDHHRSDGLEECLRRAADAVKLTRELEELSNQPC